MGLSARALRAAGHPVHLVICTYTTPHLRRCLLGVACQTRRPDSVIVTCDTDDPAVRQRAAACSREFGLPLTLVYRAHHGLCRLSQVANNAVRLLLERGAPDEAQIVVTQGDCCPAPDFIAQYAARARKGDLYLGHRIGMTDAQTEVFDEAAVRAGRPPAAISTKQQRLLQLHARKAYFHLILRHLHLTKLHKPKLVGFNHGYRLELCRRINGYDEEYEGFAVDDDEFCRRANRAGARPVICVRQAIVYHCFHPSRQPVPWQDLPSAQRFRQGGPVYCRHGLDNPRPQNPIRVEDIS